MIDIAIVGAGFIGGVHARLIDSLDEARLAAVVDIDRTRAVAVAGPRGAHVAGSLDELADAGRLPEVVSVCTVSAGHAAIAAKALSLGCHVLIEKPIDITREAVRELADAAGTTTRAIGVVSQRRFLQSCVALRRAVEDGRLGRLTGGTAESPFFRAQSYYDSGTWRGTLDRDGGGALMNQGIHVLDLLLWFLGEPRSVTAASACVAHERIEVEDVLGATVSFASGAVGTVFASTSAFPEGDARLTIYGTEGSATIAKGRLTLRTAQGEDVVDDTSPAGWNPIDWAHRAQYVDFLDAVTHHRPPAIGIADGRRALDTVLSIYEAARTGQAVSLA